MGAFSFFLLYKVDSYVKQQALDSMASQLKNFTTFAFKQGNITNSGPAHRDIFDTLHSQTNIESIRMGISTELNKDLKANNMKSSGESQKEEIERRSYNTRQIETDMTPIESPTLNNAFGMMSDSRGKVSVPIIANQYCTECHSTLKEGDVMGNVYSQFIINDSILAIYDMMKIELITIILVASVILTAIMLFSVSSFTKLVFNIKNGIQGAVQGNFTIRIKNRGVGIFSEAVKLTNRLLETLDKSINSIDSKIATIFIYKKSLYNKNPLLRITELIAEITNLFLFKNKIETARVNKEVYRELQNVISRYIKYRYLIFAEVVNNEIVSGYKIEDETEMKISVGDVKGIEKRLAESNPNVLFNDEKGCLFISTSIEQLNVIDLRIFIAENIVLYYSIAMNSKKELLEKENSISRIYNYVREARPIIKNIMLVKNIEESSYTDPLTKAYNRLYLEKYSKNIALKLQKRIDFGVLMLDIDHFKRVNDTYGHHVGDAGIVMLTETIKKIIKPTDKLFRYGGEEFVVILEGYDSDETQRAAEKIRSSFAMAKRCSLMELNFQKSVSIGFSSMPEYSMDIWECINQADLALYEAKETGRNRVIRYSPDLKEKKEQKEKAEIAKKANYNIQQSQQNDDNDDGFLESLRLNR